MYIYLSIYHAISAKLELPFASLVPMCNCRSCSQVHSSQKITAESQTGGAHYPTDFTFHVHTCLKSV